MISKCQNIVINRTKFSDFEEFDVTQQPSNGLKIVGYIETYDPCSGTMVGKNVSIDYSAVSDINIVKAPNYYVSDLQNFTDKDQWVTVDPSVRFEGDDVMVFRVNSNFEGEFIQFYIKDAYGAGTTSNIFNRPKNGTKTLFLSFAREIPFGTEIKILFRGFPASYHDGIKYAIRQLDYKNQKIGPVSDLGVLYEGDERFGNVGTGAAGKIHDVMVTFTQTAKAGTSEAAGDAPSDNRVMVATKVEIIN